MEGMHVQKTDSMVWVCRSAAGELVSDTKGRDIKIDSYTLSFHVRLLIEGAEISLNYGQRYGLLGENGSGKVRPLHVARRVSGYPRPSEGRTRGICPVTLQNRLGKVPELDSCCLPGWFRSRFPLPPSQMLSERWACRKK